MITFKNAEKCHKRMWDWLAITGEKDKNGWPEFFIPNPKNGRLISRPIFVCFACKIARWNRRRVCEICPIDWGNKIYLCPCTQEKSPFKKWFSSTTQKERMKYAAIIRDLPWSRKK